MIVYVCLNKSFFLGTRNIRDIPILQISKSTLYIRRHWGFQCMTVVRNVGFRLCVEFINPSWYMSLPLVYGVVFLIHVKELAFSLSFLLFNTLT